MRQDAFKMQESGASTDGQGAGRAPGGGKPGSTRERGVWTPEVSSYSHRRKSTWTVWVQTWGKTWGRSPDCFYFPPLMDAASSSQRMRMVEGR